MVKMAEPWKRPETGVYYIRRQIPKALRPAFGGSQLHKVSLEMKDPKRAAVLFMQANANLEAQFEAARARLRAMGSSTPSPRDRATALIQACLNEPAATPGGLEGADRLRLARLEIDRGLWDGARISDGSWGICKVRPSTAEQWAELESNGALFRIHSGTRERLIPSS